MSKPRIRHIEAVSIVNLTINPIRDQLSSLLHHPVPPSPNPKATRSFASDDVDLHLRTRKRTNSSASFGSNGSRVLGLAWHENEREKAELMATQMGNLENSGEIGVQENGIGGKPSTGMIRRKSLKGLLLEETTVGIAEELEPPSPPTNSTATFDSPTVTSPTTLEDDKKSLDFPSTAYLPTIRRRLASRASINSIATSNSGSTIRAQRTSFDATVPPTTEKLEKGTSRTSYTSELLQIKEKKSRVKALQRRLLDSFITLSIVPIETKEEENQISRIKLSRSSSSNGSLRGRKSNASSNNASPVASTSTLPLLPTQPFYVSDLKVASMNPTFDIDTTGFLVDSRTRKYVTAEERVVVSIWTRGIEKGKGKEKAEDEYMGDAKLLVEYDIDLDALVELGKDPTTFPSLPPNTLVFNLGERGYFTPPLPSEDSSSENSDDEGNKSDPGLHSSIVSVRPSSSEVIVLKENERELRRKKSGVEKGKRDAQAVNWCGMEMIEELLATTQQIELEKDSIEALHRETNSFLDDLDNFDTFEREKSEIQDRTEDFVSVSEDLQLEVEDVELELNSRRAELRARRGRLTAARELVSQNQQKLLEVQRGIAEDTKIVGKLHYAAAVRRQTVVTTLSSLFPIEPAPSSTSLLFSILDLDLPNSIFNFNTDAEESISAALGYVAQVVQMLGAYMGVPLAYNIKIMGSRSVIFDLISSMTGPRAFPLYSSGVEKYRFDYAVFLLNKNIEQLMYTQNLLVLDLRNTLPNLKSLLLSLSFDPSHASFPSSTLLAPSKAATPILDRTNLFLDYIRDSTPLFSSPTESLSTSTKRAASIRSASIRSSSPTPTITPSILNGNGIVMNNTRAREKSGKQKGRIEMKGRPTTAEVISSVVA